ncbi:hypothetical protein [Nocardia mexicana]|uniref:Uncharacterized protein n=1 Tax=Nocardia mexicana TaxID=279262 RepID=A0A370HAC5_9NOCA|nr:hypothetical protein [Nocardia mexicana]RDI53896.1 hypothetical protein DFR68_10216 [Nocardia mexicana]
MTFPLVMIIAALVILSAIVWFAPDTLPPAPTLTHPAPEEPAMDTSVWPVGWPHEAPDRPMSVSDARHSMQRHRDCYREDCPRKRAAYQTLVDAGHIKPDSARVS